jgi:hypothetical protein
MRLTCSTKDSLGFSGAGGNGTSVLFFARTTHGVKQWELSQGEADLIEA